MNKQLFLIFNLLSLLMNLGSVFFIRQILWSIVWCDKGGKYNHLRQLKKDQNQISKWSMTYLRKHTNKHTEAFDFWITIKRIEFVFFVMCMVLSAVLTFFYDSITAFANVYCIAYTGISFLSTLCFALQFDTNRNTKYDRKRIKRN